MPHQASRLRQPGRTVRQHRRRQARSRDRAGHIGVGCAGAADAFTPVPIADHKTVAAIRVVRKTRDPGSWEVHVPASSGLAASKIHQALIEHIGDMLTLANKLGAARRANRYRFSAPVRRRADHGRARDVANVER